MPKSRSAVTAAAVRSSWIDSVRFDLIDHTLAAFAQPASIRIRPLPVRQQRGNRDFEMAGAHASGQFSSRGSAATNIKSWIPAFAGMASRWGGRPECGRPEMMGAPERGLRRGRRQRSEGRRDEVRIATKSEARLRLPDEGRDATLVRTQWWTSRAAPLCNASAIAKSSSGVKSSGPHSSESSLLSGINEFPQHVRHQTRNRRHLIPCSSPRRTLGSSSFCRLFKGLGKRQDGSRLSPE